MISIFTPTYNRAYKLPELYLSLCNQTDKDFEWIVVDDGSKDNTQSLVYEWKKLSSFPIVYYFQPNGGKHRAINKGVKMANGDLFFIVDSDDRLAPDAVEWIKKTYKEIEYNPSFAGISGTRVYPNGERIGGINFAQIDTNAIDIRVKYKIKGDLAEIYRTDILREYPFPEFDGEKFCPEALIWNRIAIKYKIRYASKGIYICEYLPDGITAKIIKLRRFSPHYSMLYYHEAAHLNTGIIFTIKSYINFWRFTPRTLLKSGWNIEKFSLLMVLCFLPGRIARILDVLKI